MDEDELYDIISNSGFFGVLGYEKLGKDIRKQKAIAGSGKKPDFYCLDDYQNVVFVLEAKKPSDEHLAGAFDQLWSLYVIPLKSRYGILTNGRRIIVYVRKGESNSKVLDGELDKVTRAESDQMFALLRKPEYELATLDNLRDYLGKTERLSLQTPQAKQFFLETFALTPESIYGELVTALMALFDDTLPKSKFLRGAWSFWLHSLARKPQKIPNAWKPFLSGKSDEETLLYQFMFCLETAQALLARLMLAKACQDYGFPDVNLYDFVLKRVPNIRGAIRSIGYPIVLSALLKEMEGLLVTSVFEEDIFTWWTDPFHGFATRPAWSFDEIDVSAAGENFSIVIASIFLVFYKYEFLNLPSDVLGDLYQAYFDRETRRALGEFYTPEEVVDYILEQIKYQTVLSKRLVDPSCGSGSFLVAAVRTYLQEAGTLVRAGAKKWADVLTELCSSPRVVGLDIHPFAILITQVRFMLEILPAYKLAVEQAGSTGFRLERLPVFRTDSLAVETKVREESGQMKLIETEDELKFPVSLPLVGPTEEVMKVEVAIPSWTRSASLGRDKLANLDEYFRTAQALFDTIKVAVRKGSTNVSMSNLVMAFNGYIKGRDNARLAVIYKPYGDSIVSEIFRLQSEFEDGRLVKSIEDAVLSALLKNYMKYDFVVGNPPYVRIQRISQEQKAHYSTIYSSAQSGKWDLYCVFVEKGIDLLDSGGMLSYICSNQFLFRDYGQAIRKKLATATKVTQVLDFKDSGVFKDVTNYPCILTVQKTSAPSTHYIKCVRVREPVLAEDASDPRAENLTLKAVRRHLTVNRYTCEQFEVFGFPQQSLGQDIWSLMPPEELSVFHKIEHSGTMKLGDMCDIIYEGIKTKGADDSYFVREVSDVSESRRRVRPLKFEKASKSDSLVIEKEILRPIIKGEDVKRWKVSWKKLFLIYPYSTDAKGPQVMMESELKQNFPLAWDYLISFEAEMRKKKYVDETKSNSKRLWYELWRARNPIWFEQPKILTPNISDENKFAYDESGVFFVGSVFGIILKDAYRLKKNYLFLLGVLNSKALEFYFKEISALYSGKFFMYDTQYLEKLPIRISADKEEEATASKIVSKVEEILTRAGGSPADLYDSYVENLSHIESDYTSIVLRENHIKLEPVISDAGKAGFVVYPAKGEDPIWVDTRDKAQILSIALAGRRGSKGTAIEINVPRADNVVKEALRKLRGQINTKGDTINQLQDELDALVTQYYNLDGDDAEIINRFLVRF